MARTKKTADPAPELEIRADPEVIEDPDLIEDLEVIREELEPVKPERSHTELMMLRGLGLLPPGEDFIPTSLFVSNNVLTSGMGGGGLDADIDNGVASFNIPGKAFTDIDVLTVDIIAEQAGSGDPAPDNVRDFSGFTGADITVSPTLDPLDGTTYSVSWQDDAGTVYGGMLDVITGKLIVTHYLITLDGSESWSYAAGHKLYTTVGFTMDEADTDKACNQYPFYGNVQNSSSVTVNKAFYTQITSSYKRVFIKDEDYSDAPSFKAALTVTPLQILCQLPDDAYLEYDLTVPQINALMGVNNIWADCGPVTQLQYSYDLLINQN